MDDIEACDRASEILNEIRYFFTIFQRIKLMPISHFSIAFPHALS